MINTRNHRLKVALYRNAPRSWRWRLSTLNGEIVGASTESYIARKDAIKNLACVTGILLTIPRQLRKDDFVFTVDMVAVRASVAVAA